MQPYFIWKRIGSFVGALLALTVAALSYKYLALALFYIGLSRFYELASSVPDQCINFVSEAAVAFSGLFDYIAIAVSVAFFLLSAYFISRLYKNLYGKTQ